MSGTFIIYSTAVGLILLLLWTVFRIAQYKKKAREIDAKASEIASMAAPPITKKARATSDGSMMETPTAGVLLVMHREGTSPARGMFVSSVEKGRAGLLVTTEDPRDLPVDASVKRIWLNRSTVKGDMDNTVVVNPTNLSGTLDEIGTFVSEATGPKVVLLDRFEEVISANDVGRVIRFLNMLRERSAKDRMAILVPLGYKATPQRVRNQLMEAFETVVV